MLRASLDRLPQSTAYPPGMGPGTLDMEIMDQVTKDLVQGGRALPIIRIQTPSDASGARGGATWTGNALPQHWL